MAVLPPRLVFEYRNESRDFQIAQQEADDYLNDGFPESFRPFFQKKKKKFYMVEFLSEPIL